MEIILHPGFSSYRSLIIAILQQFKKVIWEYYTEFGTGVSIYFYDDSELETHLVSVLGYFWVSFTITNT